MLIGISLILISVLLFLEKFGIITTSFSGYIWPVLLLSLGLYIVWRKSK